MRRAAVAVESGGKARVRVAIEDVHAVVELQEKAEAVHADGAGRVRGQAERDGVLPTQSLGIDFIHQRTRLVRAREPKTANGRLAVEAALQRGGTLHVALVDEVRAPRRMRREGAGCGEPRAEAVAGAVRRLQRGRRWLAPDDAQVFVLRGLWVRAGLGDRLDLARRGRQAGSPELHLGYARSRAQRRERDGNVAAGD